MKNIQYTLYSIAFTTSLAMAKTANAQQGLDESLKPNILPSTGGLAEGQTVQSYVIRIIGNIIDFIIAISGGLAVFFIVYAGLQYVLARGQDDKISTAKSNLQWVIGGLILMFFAMVIVRFLITVILGLEEVN
jgi:hypothetical protein